MQDYDLQNFLDKKVKQYQVSSFVLDDPISIPHQYSKLQDIEIAGFFASIFAWGRRSLILKKTNTLLQLMDNAPFEFIMEHEEKDLKPFLGFVHRTFNSTDILYFISFFRSYYQKHPSLENAFSGNMDKADVSVENALNGFHNLVFSGDFPVRTKKHLSAPFKKSACKRLNMFLRWMVRKDSAGIDFGIWKNILPGQLVIPMDTHVVRVADRLGLIKSGQAPNWKTAVNLTNKLKEYDPMDPVKYDFALFGLGVVENY